MAISIGTVQPLQQLTDAWHAWAYGVLNAIGAPTTPTNLQTLWKWSIKESGRNPMVNGAIQNNPLNTTQPVVGSYAANSVGVQSFPDVSTSVDATSMTLLNGRYGAIVNNLRNSIPTQQWGADAGQQLGVWGSGTNWLGWSASPPTSSAGGIAGAGSGSRTGPNAPGSKVLNQGDIPGSNSGGGIDLGNAIGGTIGSAITQSFSQFFWVALMAAGAVLMLGGFAILAVSAFQSAPAPVKKVAGTAAAVTPVGRAAKVAKAGKGAKKATAVRKITAPQRDRKLAEYGAPRPKSRITAGGREIEVTNPESRARLRAAGYET